MYYTGSSPHAGFLTLFLPLTYRWKKAPVTARAAGVHEEVLQLEYVA